ncbi:hypothetical protein ACQP3L_39215, partial [Escherichia coli]
MGFPYPGLLPIANPLGTSSCPSIATTNGKFFMLGISIIEAGTRLPNPDVSPKPSSGSFHT